MKPIPASPRRPAPLVAAFTLVEILVSLAVLTILLLISAQVIGQVQSSWTASNARVSQFREARTAFDILTRNLSQATLNTYVDYQNNYLSAAGTPAATGPGSYMRKSDLQFKAGKAVTLVSGAGGATEATLPGHAVFFQAPLGVSHSPSLVGLDRLLCARGYFVQFASDLSFRPEFIPPGALNYRYRLMEFSPPAEENLIYSTGAGNGWFAKAGAAIRTDETYSNAGFTRPVADNILTLIISPRRELAAPGTTSSSGPPTAIAPNYSYDSTAGDEDSRHLLPPLVRVVLVAIDERSAQRLAAEGEESAPPLATVFSDAPFNTAAQLDVELENLQKELVKKRLNFRIFSATIQIRGAKWSA